MGTIKLFGNLFKSKKQSVESDQPIDNSTKTKIYNLIIVDESGSMSHLREATISGINETISTIRKAQEEFKATQEHFLTIVTFDSPGLNQVPVRTIIDAQPIERIKEFKQYSPRGCTPLFDAMGMSLSKMREQIKNDNDATVVVTVMTDGLENSSCKWNAHELKALIEQLKEQGWSFSYMGSAHDVKEVADLLSITNVVEFAHDCKSSQATWQRDSSAKMAYYRKMDQMYNEEMDYQQRVNMKKGFANEYYEQRVTPRAINQVKANEVFVFGSNPQGYHNGGAAAFAMRHCGAQWGIGEGLQGCSYAIPTTGDLTLLRQAIERFIVFAQSNYNLHFLVTAIGCGNAGYTPEQIAPLFLKCVELENVSLPEEFWAVLGLKMF